MTQNPSEDIVNDTPDEQRPQDELKAWVELLQQAVAAGATLSQLAMLELRLALADGGRLVALGLVMLPLALLAWLGLSVLIGWCVFQWAASVTLGIGAFLAVQLVTLGILGAACARYRKSLSLPATRRHLRQFMESVKPDAQATKS